MNMPKQGSGDGAFGAVAEGAATEVAREGIEGPVGGEPVALDVAAHEIDRAALRDSILRTLNEAHVAVGERRTVDGLADALVDVVVGMVG